jgi:hypothetical protein
MYMREGRLDGLTPAFIPTKYPAFEHISVWINSSADFLCIGTGTHSIDMHIILCRRVRQEFFPTRSLGKAQENGHGSPVGSHLGLI